MHRDAIILLMETSDKKKLFKYSLCNIVLIKLELRRTGITSPNYLPNFQKILNLI